MISNFAFVIHEKLAGCAHPGRDERLRRNIEELVSRHKITAIVTLSEEALPSRVLQKARLRFLHLPVPDFGVSPLKQIAQFVDFAHGEIANGGRVVVHCSAGYGRTGTMLACCLVAEEGRTPDLAIAAVRRLRPGSIETPEQENVVREWAAWHGEYRARNQDK